MSHNSSQCVVVKRDYRGIISTFKINRVVYRIETLLLYLVTIPLSKLFSWFCNMSCRAILRQNYRIILARHQSP